MPSFVVVIAAWLQRANAGTVLTELMLPQRFVVAVIADPIGVDVRQDVIIAEFGQDSPYVGVFAAGVTELRVGAIAIVRPQTVNSPGI